MKTVVNQENNSSRIAQIELKNKLKTVDDQQRTNLSTFHKIF